MSSLLLGSLTVMLNLQGEGLGSLSDVDDLTNTFSKVGCLQFFLSSIVVIMQWIFFLLYLGIIGKFDI